MDKLKKAVILLPLISGTFWGTTGIFVRLLTEAGFNSQTILFSRTLVASSVLLLLILLINPSLLKIRLKDLWIFLLGGVMGTLMLNLCYNASINRLTLSLSAVLLSLSPFFVMFLAAVLFHEKITFQKIGCMFLAFFGCILVSGVLEQGSGASWSGIGIAIGVLSAVFYAVYSISSRTAMNRGYHALTVTFYCMLFVALLLSFFSDWQAIGHMLREAPVKNTGFFLLHGICTSVFPYALYTCSLKYIETSKASMLVSVEPVAAMVFGALLFSEIPSPLSVLGLVITVAALSLLCMPKQKKAEKNKRMLRTPFP